MNTLLSIHANEMPTFEFTEHGSFQTFRLIVKTDKGDATQVTLFLPTGTTLGDMLKSVADAKVTNDLPKQEVKC